MRGHHLGVEDLTRGDDGVPVRVSLVEVPKLIFTDVETAQVGAADN
jgi:hypothetical protein